VSQAFQRVASLYSNSTPVTFDLVAAGVSGDLAYVVGYERGAASVGGGTVQPLDLRVTQVYSRRRAGMRSATAVRRRLTGEVNLVRATDERLRSSKPV
jgi:ketosteroid isomerase-like protein